MLPDEKDVFVNNPPLFLGNWLLILLNKVVLLILLGAPNILTLFVPLNNDCELLYWILLLSLKSFLAPNWGDTFILQVFISEFWLPNKLGVCPLLLNVLLLNKLVLFVLLLFPNWKRLPFWVLLSLLLLFKASTVNTFCMWTEELGFKNGLFLLAKLPAKDAVEFWLWFWFSFVLILFSLLLLLFPNKEGVLLLIILLFLLKASKLCVSFLSSFIFSFFFSSILPNKLPLLPNKLWFGKSWGLSLLSTWVVCSFNDDFPKAYNSIMNRSINDIKGPK